MKEEIQTENAEYTLRGAQVLVQENLEGQIKVLYQDKELEYKELLVRDRQGQVKNKKEILLGGLPSSGGRVA